MKLEEIIEYAINNWEISEINAIDSIEILKYS